MLRRKFSVKHAPSVPWLPKEEAVGLVKEIRFREFSHSPLVRPETSTRAMLSPAAAVDSGQLE